MRGLSGFVIFIAILCVAIVVFVKQNTPKYVPFIAESSAESCHFKQSEKSQNLAESSVNLFESNEKSQNLAELNAESQNLARGGAEYKIKSKLDFAKRTSLWHSHRSDSVAKNLKKNKRNFSPQNDKNLAESHLILPNATNSAHSSSLLDLGEKIMAVYFAGSKEGASDVKIMAHFIDKQTLQSSPQRAILDAKMLSIMAQKFIKKLGNPVIFRDKNGRIHLFVVGVSLGGWATSKIYHLQFGADLETLEFRSELKLGLLANFSHLVRTPPVLLKNGGFMLPLYYELGAKYALVAFFDENANFTHAKRINALKNQLQPTIIALDSRKCLAFFRNHKAHKNASFLQECDDFGAKWSAPSATNLMGWDDSPVLVSYKNPQNIRRILLLYNDGKILENGEWQGNSRASLGLYLLSDFAKFSHLQNIDKTKQSYPHEVSYPSALIDKNHLFIAYTHNRKNIKIKRINLADLERKISDFMILDSANQVKNAESATISQNLNAESAPISSLRGARSEASATKQSTINLVARSATKTRPLRGAKNREQGCSSATADFLLEAEKRGTPPKSEKAAAFWRVGGAGRGVQPFLREKTSESNPKNSENIADSANETKNAESSLNCHIERSEISQNRDFSPTAQNDNFNLDYLDCHDSASQNLAMTENKAIYPISRALGVKND
ncbi:exo-alpha-sialidase [Helicobacter sp. 23-1044]